MRAFIIPALRVPLLAAIVLAALPAAARANGPLAVCRPGVPYMWPSGGINIPYNPDLGELGPLSNAAAVALVRDAFNRWRAVPTASTTYLHTGPLPVDVDITNFAPYYAAPAPDGLSAVVFDDTGEIFDLLFGPNSGILGFAGPEWGDPAACTITEGLAFLNGPTFTDATVALDVLVHEFGHYQNLAHTAVNGQIALGDTTGPTPHDTFPIATLAGAIETMYPFYFGPVAGTSSPHADDRAGLSALYPAPSFATRGALGGTIFASNGRTRLTGVNVIARNLANPFEDAVSAISSDMAVAYSQTSSRVGEYTIRGLTPGASYAVYVDEILAGGFSTPPLSPLPGAEEFYNAGESNDRDTDNPATFTPVVPMAGQTITGISIILNAFKPGDILPISDDGSLELALPFRFDVCGESFDSVFVNANGSLTFGSPSADFTESRLEFLDGPARAAGLWRDLNPAAGGAITFAQTAQTFTVMWTGVPEYPAAGANSFSVKLYRAYDRIDMSYGRLEATSGIAGVSCGGNGTSRFEGQQDLSRSRQLFVQLFTDAAGYELFSPERPFDLQSATIRYTGTLDYNDRWAGHNNTPATAKRVPLPFSSASALRYTELERADDLDFFKFNAKAGQIVLAEVQTGQVDTLLGAFTAAGTLLAVDDDNGANRLSRLAFIAPADGDYTVGVTTFPDFAFTGAGSETGRYVLSLQVLGGSILPLADDESVPVDLGFAFRFHNRTYTSVFVNANGNLTFGGGDGDFSPSAAEFLGGLPRIAPFWQDLVPAEGLVVATREPGAITVHFLSVPTLFSERGNYFSVRLAKGGGVRLSHHGVLAEEGLTGLTGGFGTADPGQANLSRLYWSNPAGRTTYEIFTPAAPFDIPFRTLRFD